MFLKRIKNIFFIFLLALAQNLLALGLSTTFGKVYLKDLKPGQTYTTKNNAGIELKVKNSSTVNINLKVDVVIPKPGEVEEGYEPLPDSSWISLNKDYFPEVGRGKVAATDVIVKIPKKKKYLGKKYQVYLWSHTVGGGAIGIGLNSKLFLHIREKRKRRGFIGNILRFFGLKKK